MSETKKPEAFFDKVVFGGYDTVQVDEFVIEAKKIIAQYKKDNALLTQKLKILADEINSRRNAKHDIPEDANPEPEKTSDVEVKPDKAEDPPENGIESLVSLSAELSQKLMEQYRAQSEALRAELEKILEIADKTSDVIGSILTMAEAKRESQSAAPETSTAPAETEQTAAQTQTADEDRSDGTDTMASVFDDIKQSNADIVPEKAEQEAEAGTEMNSPENPPENNRVFYVTRIENTEENTAPADENELEPEKAVPEKAEQEVKPVAVNTAEKVAPGEEVILDSNGIDTSNLTYEEALALVLSKNGIRYRSAGLQSVPEDNEKKKEFKATLPAIEQIKPGRNVKRAENRVTEKKEKKEKKPGLVSLIKQGINAILEDEDDEDEDDDSLDPSIFDEIKAAEQPLQFGKDYDVKKKS